MRNLILCLALLLPLTSFAAASHVQTPKDDPETTIEYIRHFIENVGMDESQRARLSELFEKAIESHEHPYLPREEIDELRELVAAAGGQHLIRARLEATGCMLRHTLTLYTHDWDPRIAIEALREQVDSERLKANGIIAFGIAEWQDPNNDYQPVLGFHYLRDTSVKLTEENAYIIWGFAPIWLAAPHEIGGFPVQHAFLKSFDPLFVQEAS